MCRRPAELGPPGEARLSGNDQQLPERGEPPQRGAPRNVRDGEYGGTRWGNGWGVGFRLAERLEGWWAGSGWLVGCGWLVLFCLVVFSWLVRLVLFVWVGLGSILFRSFPFRSVPSVRSLVDAWLSCLAHVCLIGGCWEQRAADESGEMCSRWDAYVHGTMFTYVHCFKCYGRIWL